MWPPGLRGLGREAYPKYWPADLLFSFRWLLSFLGILRLNDVTRLLELICSVVQERCLMSHIHRWNQRTNLFRQCVPFTQMKKWQLQLWLHRWHWNRDIFEELMSHMYNKNFAQKIPGLCLHQTLFHLEPILWSEQDSPDITAIYSALFCIKWWVGQRMMAKWLELLLRNVKFNFKSRWPC